MHDLTAVIPTRDRPEQLRRTLDSLAAESEGGRVHVIVVDDGSANALGVETACGEAADSLDIQLRRTPPRGPAAARNLGASMAKTQRLLFLGDDTPLAQGALEHHANVSSSVGLQGRIDWHPRLAVTKVMEFLAPEGPQFYFRDLIAGEPVSYRFVLGSNLSVPRQWLDDQPFDEGFRHACFEDTEVAYRWQKRGRQVLWEPRAQCWHDHFYDSLDPFLSRQVRAGRAARRAVLRHPRMASAIVVKPLLVFLKSLVWRGSEADPTNRWNRAVRGAYFRGVFGRVASDGV